MTPTPAAPSGEQIRFRFFKNLVEAERRKVFEVFGVIPEGCADKLDHSIEARLLKLMLNNFRAAVSQAAPEQATQPVELLGVSEQLADGAGFWHSCSGCHDTEDGYPTGNYHYSEALRCALGSGCSECGGIGAVWDNNDYAELVKEESRALAAPSGAPKQEIPAKTGNAWHDAVMAECMRVESCYVASDPAQTLTNLINWHTQDALGVNETIKIQADNYLRLTCGTAASTVQSAPVPPEPVLTPLIIGLLRGEAIQDTSSTDLLEVRFARLVEQYVLKHAAAQSTPVQVDGQQLERLEPVDGDLLPPVGTKVLIHLGRQDAWVEHTVAGYYAWAAYPHQVKGGHAHRVFVRVRDTNGYLNARLLDEVRPVARQGGEHAPEAAQELTSSPVDGQNEHKVDGKQALALPVAAAPEQKP